MNLQYSVELQLKDYEHRKLLQMLNTMKNTIEKMKYKFEHFNDIKLQLTQTFQALVKNVQLELQNLKKELIQYIEQQKEQFISQVCLNLDLNNREIYLPQDYQENERLKQRCDQLTKQIMESEKHEIYLMRVNRKYMEENQQLLKQLQYMSNRRDYRQLSMSDKGFFPNQTGFSSRLYNHS